MHYVPFLNQKIFIACILPYKRFRSILIVNSSIICYLKTHFIDEI